MDEAAYNRVLADTAFKLGVRGTAALAIDEKEFSRVEDSPTLSAYKALRVVLLAMELDALLFAREVAFGADWISLVEAALVEGALLLVDELLVLENSLATEGALEAVLVPELAHAYTAVLNYLLSAARTDQEHPYEVLLAEELPLARVDFLV